MRKIYSKLDYQNRKSWYSNYYQENKERIILCSATRSRKFYKERKQEWNICHVCSKELPLKRRVGLIRTCSKECAEKHVSLLRRKNAKDYYLKNKEAMLKKQSELRRMKKCRN